MANSIQDAHLDVTVDRIGLLKSLKFPTSSLTPNSLVTAVLGLLLAYAISSVIYNVFFHPLAHYPGPRLAAASQYVYLYYFYVGDSVAWMDQLHRQYGEVVRTGPSRLSYITPEALKDIYGHTTASHKGNPKDDKFLTTFPNGYHSIVTVPTGPAHSKMRKIFSNAFSDRALTQQEPMILQYACQLVDLVRRRIAAAKGGNNSVVLNAVSLFNFATFDIMADLTFGESLGNLEKGVFNPWVEAVMVNFKGLMLFSALLPHPILLFIWSIFQPKQDKETAAIHVQNAHRRVTKRLEKGADARPDIWGLVLKSNSSGEMPREEMDNNADTFMTAGTETTATALSGITYLLLKNPDKLERLVKEIRSVDDESQLKGDVLRHMKYFQAVMEEGMRLYPPVPFGGLRIIGEGGNTILGQYLPKDTQISIANYTAYHTPLYWKDPEKFLPERWISGEPGYEEHYSYDRREVFSPFSTGPRACIGKNLAYHEMRLLYSYFLYNFDIELCPESDGWTDHQKTWNLWEKDELNIRITPRK